MAQKTPVILSDNRDQHIPLGDNDTIRVSDVPVSAQDGNMIQLRDDGIYYGTTAPADISTLYVSTSLGSDSNAGTRAAPLQSVDKAMEIIAERNSPGSYSIRLKAGESFAFQKRTYFPVGEFALRFSYYDDPLFGDILARSGYYPVADARLRRPTLTVDTYVLDTINNIVGWTGFAISTSGIVSVQGVNLIFQQSGAGAVTGGGWCWYVKEIQLSGCDFTLNSDHEGVGSAQSILTRQCNFYRNGTAHFFISDYSPGWMDAVWVSPGTTNKDPYGVGPDVTGREYNMRSVVTPDNGMALASYDAGTKTLFGWSTNWDVFAGV